MERHGTFSSSQIWKLLTVDKTKKNFGKPAETYMREVADEIELGRAIQNERDARQTSWGNFVQYRVFDLLSNAYTMIEGEVRYAHPTIRRWTGVPDTVVFADEKVSDIKCPFALKTFSAKIRALKKGVEYFKDEFPEDYWQLISNAILLRANGYPINTIESIIYVPYKEELAEIRIAASMFDGDQNPIAFINWSADDSLPYLLPEKKHKNLNIHSFPIDENDIELLTSVVERANEVVDKMLQE
jgi:hypothetical protein